MGYRIKTVAEMTGVPRNTLLAWERRYSIVTPHRQDNGYREYSDADVAVLRELKRIVDQGHKVSEAIALIDQARNSQPPPDDHLAPRPLLARIGQEMLQALLCFDRQAAYRLTVRLSAFPYQQTITELYFPMLQAVGDGWQRGDISIPQEHYVSQFVREQLVAMLLNVQGGPATGPHAICAGFPGERHDLALLGIAVHLALQGQQVTLLGADVPTADLGELAAKLKPDLVCVSVMQPRSTEEIDRYLRQLRDAAPPSCRVVLGGRGLPPELPQVPGAEIYRSAQRLLGH